MSFNTEEFRARARARALKERARREGVDPTREQRIAKIKESIRAKRGEAAKSKPSGNTALREAVRARFAEKAAQTTRAARIAKLKEKLQNRIDPKRPSRVAEGSVATKARVLKERVKNLRRWFKENEEALGQFGAPGAAPLPGQEAIPGQEGQAPAVQLPPEVVSEIQSIATAAQALAQMAGIQPATDLGAAPEAGIPGVTADAQGGAAPGTQPVLESTRRRAIVKAIKEKLAQRKAARVREDAVDEDPAPEEKDEVDALKERIAQRRQALATLRNTMAESYEELGNPHDVSAKALELTGIADANYTQTGKVLQQAGVKKGGDSAFMPGKNSLKAAKVWQPQNLKYGGKAPEGTGAPKGPGSAPAQNLKYGGKALTESAQPLDETSSLDPDNWADRHISKFTEAKMDFQALLRNGMLG